MSAIEDMTRDELLEAMREMKARIAEFERAEINRRFLIEEHPATIEAFMENIPEAIVLSSAPDAVVRMISRYALDFFEIKRGDVEGAPISKLLDLWQPYNPDGTFIEMDDRPTMSALKRGVSTKTGRYFSRIMTAGKRLFSSMPRRSSTAQAR